MKKRNGKAIQMQDFHNCKNIRDSNQLSFNIQVTIVITNVKTVLLYEVETCMENYENTQVFINNRLCKIFRIC